MKLISRMGLLVVMTIACFSFSTETAEAQIFPIFKCRKRLCCKAEPAPEPEPVCCPAEDPEPAPEPVCCSEPAAEPEPAPEVTCCPEPAPAPVCYAEPAPEQIEPEPAPEPSPCCCCCCCGPVTTEAPTEATTEAPPEVSAAEVSEYGMPELAEGETLVSISPIEVPTDSGSTLTSAPATAE